MQRLAALSTRMNFRTHHWFRPRTVTGGEGGLCCKNYMGNAFDNAKFPIYGTQLIVTAVYVICLSLLSYNLTSCLFVTLMMDPWSQGPKRLDLNGNALTLECHN